MLYIYIYIYVCVCVCVCVCVLSNAKSADGGNNSIFGFSFYNIPVIQNPKERSGILLYGVHIYFK